MAFFTKYHQLSSPHNDCLPTDSHRSRVRSRIWIALASYLAVFIVGALLGYVAPLLLNTRESPMIGLSLSPIPTKVFTPRIPTVMTPDERYIGWSDFANENWLAVLQGKLVFYHFGK